MLSVSERVVRYMAATPPGISGNHGHPQTFKASSRFSAPAVFEMNS